MTADRTVSFLFPDMPQFQIDPNTLDDTPEEIFLKNVMTANGGLQTLIKLALRGFLAGHNFVYVKPQSKRLRGTDILYPSINILDPTSVAVYWRADDVSDVIWYEQRYYVGDVFYIKDYINEGKRWVIRTYAGQQKTDNFLAQVPTNHQAHPMNFINFEETVFKQVEFAIHGSSLPPIIEWAHLPHPDDYYGLNEVSQKELQDTINAIATERMRIMRMHSEPLDIITGADPDEVEGEGSVITISNPAARHTRAEMKGDLTGLTLVLDKLIETYLSIARVVLLKGEAKDLQRVTNASVRTLFLDALSKNSVLQSSYAGGLADICKLCLQMGYKSKLVATNPQDLQIAVKFGSALPIDMTEIANINASGIAGGYLSPTTAAINSGYNPAFEFAAIEAHQKRFKPDVQKDPIDNPQE